MAPEDTFGKKEAKALKVRAFDMCAERGIIGIRRPGGVFLYPSGMGSFLNF